MDMPQIRLSMYEALTDAGVKPDAARKVEREVEAAIQAGHEVMRAEMRDNLITKADGAQLKAELKADMGQLKSELLKAMNEQTWKLIGFVVVFNSLLLALMLKLR